MASKPIKRAEPFLTKFMKLSQKSILLLICACLGFLSVSAPSYAHEDKKEEKKKEEGKKEEGKKEEHKKEEGKKEEHKKEEHKKEEHKKEEGKKEEHKKEEGKKEEHKKEEHKKEEHGEHKKEGKEGKESKKAAPQRTYEGIEPLFYLDAKRKPYIEPFSEHGEDKYYLCRGTVGEWYREVLTKDMNILAAKSGVAPVTGRICAMRLVPTEKPPNLPIVTIEFYLNTDVMRTCLLGDHCPQPRFVIFSVKDRTLYRTFILSDHSKHIYKEYCLNNKSEVLADTSCWKHFEEEE